MIDSIVVIRDTDVIQHCFLVSAIASIHLTHVVTSQVFIIIVHSAQQVGHSEADESLTHKSSYPCSIMSCVWPADQTLACCAYHLNDKTFSTFSISVLLYNMCLCTRVLQSLQTDVLTVARSHIPTSRRPRRTV